jgi:hypothetical protein
MSWIEEFGSFSNGWFSLTGWAGAGSLRGMLLRPASVCVIDVQF